MAALGDELPDPDAVANTKSARYSATNAKKGVTAPPPSLKAAAVAVKHLVGSFKRAASEESGGFSRISSAGSVWAFEGITPKPLLKDIETLYLTHNLLDRLPDELSNLRTLKQLWINANNIAALPSSISVLTNLEILSCSNNAITSVRSEVGCCASLTQLLLRSNRLGLADSSASSVAAALPEHLGLLTSLKVLDLAENRLTTLPIELGRLHQALLRLNLESNTWRFPSQPIVDSGRAKTLAFLLEQYEEKLQRYRIKAQERQKTLRENPQQLGYTREEANAIIARAGVSMRLKHGPGHPEYRLYSPLELDSGLVDT
eukprot:Tamp_19595.p1 GENE.Tamp_19595~~Tamp_19595.p1  ORF type:complete len:359 (+),score=51.83 Tamp_19595:128-1078(+)